MDAMFGKKVKKWSKETIQKSIVAYQMGGAKLLNFSRRYLVPLCAPSTLFEIVKDLTFKPGVIQFNLKVLKELVRDFLPHQRHGDLKIDEKSIIEGQSRDYSSDEFVGKITLPASNELASNALVIQLTLMDLRLKMVVGYHFTGKSTSAEAMKNFLFELIREVENTCDLKIHMIGCDMGPSNISFINSIGLNVQKGARQNSTIHPNDASRTLKINLDPVHNLKNLANGLRNHDVIIPSTYVEKYNLSSQVARFKDIEKLFNQQKKWFLSPRHS